MPINAHAHAHVVLSCEHATARLPVRWRRALAACLPRGQSTQLERALTTHAGVDFGALDLARALGRALGVPVIAARHTRLLVDCNRSAHHPNCLSRYSRALPQAARERLLAEVYRPHRSRVAAAVAQRLRRQGRALHVALHSFTPHLHGKTRPMDLGVLYDSTRNQEAAYGRRLARALSRLEGPVVVRRNAPYRGAADGLPTALRRRHPDGDYLGIELEVNQAWTQMDPALWRRRRRQIVEVLVHALHKNF